MAKKKKQSSNIGIFVIIGILLVFLGIFLGNSVFGRQCVEWETVDNRKQDCSKAENPYSCTVSNMTKDDKVHQTCKRWG